MDLRELQASHVFDPVPLRSGVHGLHVPFDELLGHLHTEAALTRAVLAFERLIVTGRSGVGKTSLIQYALDADERIAVLRVPVDAEDDQTVTEPQAFAAHVVRTVTRQLVAAGRLDAEARTQLVEGVSEATRSVRRASKAGLGLPRWAADASIARELEQVTSGVVARSAEEVIDQARAVVETVAARGLVPVVVVDDSDAWLSTAAGDRSALVGPFFTRVVKVLSHELPAALVFAVHDHYLDMPAFPTTGGFLENRIAVPPLPAASSLARILQARLPDSDCTAVLSDVVAVDAVDLLFESYVDALGNIRVTLLLAHAALQAACEDGSPRISRRHVEVAMTRFPAGPRAGR